MDNVAVQCRIFAAVVMSYWDKYPRKYEKIVAFLEFSQLSLLLSVCRFKAQPKPASSSRASSRQGMPASGEGMDK